jgi:plastocyanin
MRLLVQTTAVALTAALAFAACGKKSPSAPGSNAFTVTVVRQNGAQSFSPNPANPAGKPVVFRNSDTVTHRMVLNDGSVDTGDIAPGATSREVTMPAGGTNYHCSIHPDMIGAVGTSSGNPPPPCEGLYCDDD